jgi:hypothetical protein
MERGMKGNFHVPCGAGEKLEITSNAYLLQTFSGRWWQLVKLHSSKPRVAVTFRKNQHIILDFMANNNQHFQGCCPLTPIPKPPKQ